MKVKSLKTPEAFLATKTALYKWHKKKDFTVKQIWAWVNEAEFQMDEGNPPSFEIKAWESVKGYTIEVYLTDCIQLIDIPEEE